jgi:Transposase DDE domain group 1
MQTECRNEKLEFQAPGTRPIGAEFNGGTITSDGGVLLLKEVEAKRQIIKQFAACFTDYRDPEKIEHPVEDMVAQRVYGLGLGYEDLNDHDLLRRDPLLAAVVGKRDPIGEDRRRETDRGSALAGKSTLNRLELRSDDPQKDGRYKKIAIDATKVEELFVKIFLQAHDQAPEFVIFDLDATDDPLHGHQEGRFFHGYYRNYCYLPLYIFCGDFLLSARLRQSNQDQSVGALDEIKRIITQVRESWPEVRIILRGDCGFSRDEMMTWCEGQKKIDYVFGQAKNERLLKLLNAEMEQAKKQFEATGLASRVFGEKRYQTLESWSCERRVVGKAEHLEKGANPRFVVTSLKAEQYDARALYEDLYCARGEMENRIKEQQLELFADRTSTKYLQSNQTRLWFSSITYVLMNEMRRLGLAETEMEQAQCSTMRLKLLEIGAQVQVTIRRVAVRLASSYPFQELFIEIYRRLRGLQELRM